jgi:aromatic-amino-acid transaminase
MEGFAPYRSAIQTLLFGNNHPALNAGRIATIQTLGGSGALKVGADFLKRYFPDSDVGQRSDLGKPHRYFCRCRI